MSGNACCPVTSVIDSCTFVANTAKSVKIDPDALEKFISEVSETDLNTLRKKLDWKESGWHFKDETPLTAQYVFVLDSLNFCFWPTPGFEYEHLAVSLKRVLEADPKAFDGQKLATLTEDTLRGWFKPFDLPNLQQRVRFDVLFLFTSIFICKFFHVLQLSIYQKKKRSLQLR